MSYRRSPFVLSLAFCVAAACSSLAQTPAVRIMPLGDSITYGASTGGGYRLPLYIALTNAGYNVDYVGTRTDNSAAGLGAEINHQGLSGWKISDASIGLYENIYGWFESVDDPHVVLVHIGTNDSGGGSLFTNAVDRLDALITRIALCQPSAHIIVTSLLKRGEPNYTAITNYFNPFVPVKVAGQQALGRRVHFLDMNAYLELSDMYDNLHPNAGGYQKMANAWFPAITNIIGTNVVANQPAPIRAVWNSNYKQVSITFNKKVSYASATNAANYAITNAAGATLAVTGLSLNAAQRTVTLSTAAQTPGKSYFVTMNNIADDAAALTIPADSQVSFVAPSLRGSTNYVAESANYRLVYSVDLPATASYDTTAVPYSTDNSATVGPFSRVAYYLELQKSGEDLQYLWVSMDAFTNRADKLGIPTFASDTVHQKFVKNMNVFCNVPGVTTGTGLATGNIEFWPWNYTGSNALGVPGASASAYDFGDQCSFSGNYGCMQVHNCGAAQTLFAINHWNAAATLEIGIGSQPTGSPDWTLNGNAGGYTIKTLQVFVLCDTSADATAPVPLSAQAGFARNLVTVTFDEAIAPSSVSGLCFGLDNGVEILSATLLPDQKTVNLTTTAQPDATPLTLAVGDVRDLAGNRVAPGTALAVTPSSTLPPAIAANVGALATGYRVVYALDIPVKGNFNAAGDFYRVNQSNFTGSFDRVAYYLELVRGSGATQYVWTAMDPFTGDARKIGVPTAATGAAFQRYVGNLDVKSNVAGISNGVSMAGGSMEFWPGNYSQTNALSIPNASSSTYDFGDRMDAGSYGCMQIHNPTYSQTLFGINNWGADNNPIGLGIGNNASPVNGGVDWTFADNAATYLRRQLYVLVRPATPALPQEVARNVPEAAGYQLAYTVDLPVNGSFNTNSPSYYTANNYTNGLIPSVFTRIGYYLELRSSAGATQFVWTAMDAFTSDARKIAIPTNNCFFQQKVSNLSVRSNVGGIVTGDAIATGNIEIWPSDYTQGNAIGIPNASAAVFDFGDGGGSGTSTGYGCLQVHNHGAGATQTLFAVNNFNNNATLCAGIGNNTAGNPDWTHTYNAGSYSFRRLHVFVLPGGNTDTTRPTLTKATASRSLNQVVVSFSETLGDSAATPSFYALNNGASVTAAALAPSKKDVVLTTSALAAGQTYTLTVSGVRDRSAAGNPILPGSSVSFTTSGGLLSNVLTNIAEAAGYDLIHQVAIPNTANWAGGCSYSVDESLFTRTQSFDRVAYCLELLGTNSVYQWAYVSMDAFTPDISKIGVPTADRAALWQTYVSNLNVYASDNLAGSAVTTGRVASGNLEFWPSNYSAANDKGIPGASATAYDFGDGGSPSATAPGHGSMQIHNCGAKQTLIAINHFGSNGFAPELGIGNQPSGEPDWTFANNAAAYTVKNLYVLARPGPMLSTSSGTPPEIWSQPHNQTAYLRDSARFSVYAPTATAFQWRRNGAWIAGATQSSLVISPVQLADGATYDVIVTGPSGVAASQSATLSVIPYTRPQAPKPIRILPLGDSITYGVNTPGGYRHPLYAALTNAGYSVDFVGTQTGNTTNALPDADHEGHSGWTIGQIDANILDWFYAISDPDVILLHIGTNDSGAGDFSNRVDRLDSLVTKMATNRPSAHIIVTTLMKRAEPNYTAITNYFNPYVAGKVAAQQALGRKVHFLDMHACLELSDMFDNLHPNAGGYQKMANAWFPAITNVVGVYGDDAPPVLARAASLPGLQGVQAVFSKALDPETATNFANYALSGGVAITGASLSADLRTVTLATSALMRNASYTLTVSGLKDYAWPVQHTVAAGSGFTFKATTRGYLANVPEAAGYRLAYAVNLPNSAAYGGNLVAYSTNNAALINQPLSRVAYYLELQPLNGDLTYLWVSMDAFTTDVNKIGVPARVTGAVFQQYVNNMNVACNDPSVATGTGLRGNIEFWPTDYGSANTAGISKSNDALYDFGDERRTTGSYGSMQVHNPDAGQTLFAFNNWGSAGGATPDLGIGNCPAPKNGGLDWTFSNNAGNYALRTLYVLVATGEDTTPPTLVSAQAGSAGTLVTVAFSEKLVADSVDARRFTLDRGVAVVTARLLPDQRTVALTTTPQAAGDALTLTVTGVVDLGGGNPIAPGSAIAVAPAALPPEVAANVGAQASGYQLVYTLDIPATGNFNSQAELYRYNQSLATGAFDRVAYYLELVQADASTQYVWTAMDAFTQYRQQLGVPMLASKAVFQQYVSNLVVKSNVSGVSNNTFAAGGNIEFWPSSYTQPNGLGIANASGSYFDFGDTRGTGAGYGSMQVHNAGVSQVLFALNHWGTDGSTLDVGIGNRPGQNDKDWTNAGNAGSCYRRTLHVLVRPSAAALAPDLPAEILANVPAAAAGYQLVCSITNIPSRGYFNSSTSDYVVDRRASVLSNSFRRIAYYLELQTATDAVPRYVWTSMDAFTTDPAKIGIPLSGTLFQQRVSNLDVFSNVPSVTNGTGLTTGNIEFWPGNYAQANDLSIPGASASTFDFGDGGASSSVGHGCMQVHNYGAKQTVWAINHFNNGNTTAVGIGNGPNSGDPDYTFTYNADTYTRKVFHVLVLPGGDNDTAAPVLTGALGSRSLDKVLLTFSEPLADRAAAEGAFSLDGGVSVLGATLATNKTSIVLATTPMSAGQTYQVTVSGVRDRSSNNNAIVPNSKVSFTAQAAALPNVLAGVPEIGAYSLIHQLAVTDTLNYIPAGAPYSVDESRFSQTGPFDRIAYCLELTGTNGFAQWVYVSMDAFTADLTKIGVPTPDRGAAYQQYVSNLTVCASANIANGTVTTGQVAVGNIEFWPGDYSEGNALGIAGASATTFDVSDTRSGGGTYGSMQVHNTAARQTLFAFNHFGGNGFRPILGIGNQPSGQPDWTFNENALAYSVKRLYVLVRWSGTTTTGNGPEITVQPKPQKVNNGGSATLYVDSVGATSYQWRKNGAWIPGATSSWLSIAPAGSADEGTYDVLVSSATGSTLSQSAGVTVINRGTVLMLN